MITITIIINDCKPKWIRKAVKNPRRAAREDTDSSTRSFPPWQWQNTNQTKRFQKRCCGKNTKNVPAVAENNDLEQGSSAQRHSCLRWGRNALGCSFLRFFIDGFDLEVNYEHKRGKETPFSIAFCTALVLNRFRQKQ